MEKTVLNCVTAAIVCHVIKLLDSVFVVQVRYDFFFQNNYKFINIMYFGQMTWNNVYKIQLFSN